MLQEVEKQNDWSSTIPQKMSVVEITSPGGPEKLRPAIRPVPAPGTGEVLIRVCAAGVNRPDVVQRQGRYPMPPGASDLPGLEVSGEVVVVGPDVVGLARGDHVTALLNGGGYADYAVAPASLCLPVPVGLSMIEAAALPETFFTVWNNLFQRACLRAGETVLIHGGTSGIGTVAIQLATAMGAVVLATAGTPEKVEACTKLGAKLGIDYRKQDFVEVVKEVTDGRGADVILDIIGGEYVQRDLDALAVDGRLALIGVQGGAKATIDIGYLLRKRLTIVGSTLRGRSLLQKSEIAEGLKKFVWPLLSSGRVRPQVYATFPLPDAEQAHRLMEASSHIGKIVLTLG